MKLKNAILFGCAWVVLALGVVGIFVPVLPTTPLVLLSAFLFANSSPRYHKWLQGTKVYKSYVEPYRRRGGITLKQKIRILVITYIAMGISGFLVQKIYVWIILGVCAACQFYFMALRVPTVPEEEDAEADGGPKALAGKATPIKPAPPIIEPE
ncbi:MAG: YbaN family protein [Coriobacteriales bacterium]|jgi:uncharacterized membrane protein YbaN (DUF454 family)|nr:YbaN family protein [Coriobacteriales bacterium]